MSLHHLQNRSLPAILLVAAATALLAIARPGLAAVVVNQTHLSGAGAYTVSSTDLLQGLLPDPLSIIGPHVGTESTSPSPLPLTNGVFGPTGGGNLDPNGATTGQQIFVTSSNSTIHTVLNYILPTAAGGYDITNINTYTGWNDAGRSRQGYSISYAVAGDPMTFIPLATVAHAEGGANQSTELAITGLNGVVALKFAFPSQQNTYVGYREIDVIGTAAVPEPAGIAVLGLGGCALLARRRHQTSNAW
jgi:hypothetical protein